MSFIYFLLIGLISLVIKKKWILPLIILHEFLLIGLTTWDLVPKFIAHGYDFLVIFLFIRFVDLRKFGKNIFLKLSVAIIIYSLITMFIFNTSIEVFIMGFRTTIIPLLLFTTIISINIPYLEYSKVLKWIINISIFQVIISICQFLYLGEAGDSVGGTLGSNASNQLMLFQVTVICLILDSAFKSKSFTVQNFFLVLFLSIPPLVGSSKLGLIIIPLVFLIFLIKYQMKGGFSIQMIGVSILLLTFGYYLFQGLITERDLKILSDREELENYNEAGIIDEGRSMARGSIVPLTLNFLNKKNVLLTGVGLGNLYYSENVLGNSIHSNNQYMATRIGFVKVLGELGLIGMVIIIIFYRNIIKMVRSNKLIFVTKVSYFCMIIITLIIFISNTIYSGTYLKGAGNITLLVVFGYLYSLKKEFQINNSKLSSKSFQ